MKKKFVLYTMQHNGYPRELNISPGVVIELTEEEYLNYLSSHYDSILIPYQF